MISLLILEMGPWLGALWCTEYSVRAAHTVVYWCWTTKTGSAQPHYLLTQRFPSTWHTYAVKHTAAAPYHSINRLFVWLWRNVVPLDVMNGCLRALFVCDYLSALYCHDDKCYLYRVSNVFPPPHKNLKVFSLAQCLTCALGGGAARFICSVLLKPLWARHRVNYNHNVDIRWISHF